jgi:hypothetical protein
VCAARDKKDVVVFVNGDRMTCEIIKLEKGYLYVKLVYGDGTVSLDWSKVTRIESPHQFVIADKDGVRYMGVLKSSDDGKPGEEPGLQVSGRATSKVMPNSNVIEMEQADTSVLHNLRGDVDTGLSYSKQQNRTQYSLNSDVDYSRAKWSAGASFDTTYSGGGPPSSLRNDLQLKGTRQLRTPRNFALGIAEFQHNTEQELALRTSLGGALGHNFRSSNNSLIAAYLGANWNRERYSSQATVGQEGNSAEGIVGAQLNFFRFKTTNFLVNTRVYPSFTDLGRTRLDLNTSVKFRVAKDLYWNFTYYLNFDSRPPQDLPMTDFGATSGLGWKF